MMSRRYTCYSQTKYRKKLSVANSRKICKIMYNHFGLKIWIASRWCVSKNINTISQRHKNLNYDLFTISKKNLKIKSQHWFLIGWTHFVYVINNAHEDGGRGMAAFTWRRARSAHTMGRGVGSCPPYIYRC